MSTEEEGAFEPDPRLKYRRILVKLSGEALLGNEGYGIDPEVRAAFDAAVKQCEELGAEIQEVSMPHTEYGVATYYIVATAEASANLARFDGIRYGNRVDGDPMLAKSFQLDTCFPWCLRMDPCCHRRPARRRRCRHRCW